MTEYAATYLLLANALEAAPIPPWMNPFLNVGIAGAMLVYFILRDKRTEARWDAERQGANQLQRENTKALNLMTRSIMVQIVALRHVDATTKELAEKIKEEADAAISADHK